MQVMLAGGIESVMLVAAGMAALAVAGGVVAWMVHRSRRRARRALLAATPMTVRQRVIVEKALPWFRSLPEEVRLRLEGVAIVLLDEKQFVPCGDLDAVTEEMRLVIAVQAGLLVVNRPGEYFDSCHSILLYPTAFTVPVVSVADESGALVIEEEEERVGESSATGSVVLAWDSVLRGGYNHEDGLNVVLHEFAHQLDQANGDADGAPIFRRAAEARSWARVFSAAYGDLRDDTESGRESVLDPYGAEDPAEFFAVATETFFERPAALRAAYPELFAELARFYRLDPSVWRVSGGGTGAGACAGP